MKKECKVLRPLNSLASALCIVLAMSSSAFANNAPGPLAAVSMFSLVILLVALTFAGGGYNIQKRLDDAKYSSKVKRTIMNTLEFIAGLVLFFVGIMTTILGVLVLSLYAIGRGVKMIQWSRAAEKEGAKPAHFEGVSPNRLKIAGIVLIVLTVIVFGYSIANLDEVTGTADYRKRGHAAMLNAEARNAMTVAEAYLIDNPKAKMVTCEDLLKTGLIAQHNEVTCFSDLTATSGSIRMTGPKSWKLTKPVAVITYAHELTPAEQ
jgi:hypothetical protein